jgi:hypothetical protein
VLSRSISILAFAILVGSQLAAAQPDGLPPGALLLPESALPEYERTIDHAGLIRGWNNAALQRGERIFRQVCHSCHGDLNLPGSLPTALRFAEGAFQHGSDPYALYQTLTRGWRQMAPQPDLVPREKYDVIHYVRQTFLAPHNSAQYFAVTDAYLATLPKGNSAGPPAAKREPWREMDYGPFLIGTFELADATRRAAASQLRSDQLDAVSRGANLAPKAIAIRLDAGPGGVAAGQAWVAFEHDTLRLAGGWTGTGFIDWEGINFNGRHVVRPRTAGEVHFETADGPGWANPAPGTFDDARITGADGRRFGPLPRSWMRFRGLHSAAGRVMLAYTVGQAAILESHDLEMLEGLPVFVRTLNIGTSPHELVLRAANTGTAVAVSGAPALRLEEAAGFVVLRIPAAATPLRLALRLARAVTPGLTGFAARAPAPRDLGTFTSGGPARWPEVIETPVVASGEQGAFAWERLTLPQQNPWKCRVRPSGLDFLPGSAQAVVCTWDGDVWRVDGLAAGSSTLAWRRIASGLFQPLGIKVRGAEIFVLCRDQLVRLCDLNGDGETDFYECFNSDHQVTEHFHEFAMGLQADAAGNFYYAKSARHARTALVPQHGTLLRIDADGAATAILAHGFRAANGVCLNPDGSFFVTDQEGHWMPMNRINHITPGNRFFGNMWGYGAPADAADSAMAPPLCWVDKAFDRSPAELLWTEGPLWSRFPGTLLNLSYGFGRLEMVFFEKTGEAAQGALCTLPIPDFPTGIMRGRFHPGDGQLYLCGLSAWATSQTLQEGGFYRLRPTGRPACLPVAWHIVAGGLELTLSEPPQRATAVDPSRYSVKTWGLRRSANYGSPRIGERSLAVTGAELHADPRTVRLAIPALAPTDVIEIACRLRDQSGAEVERVVTGTIHRVPSPSGRAEGR